MPARINSTFVRMLREQKGWTQEQLAESAQVTPRTIQRVESVAGTSLKTLAAVATALDVEPDVLKLVDHNPVLNSAVLNAAIWLSTLILVVLLYGGDGQTVDRMYDIILGPALLSIFVVPWVSNRLRIPVRRPRFPDSTAGKKNSVFLLKNLCNRQ